MKESIRQSKVDDLVDHFWKNGYLTLSQKIWELSAKSLKCWEL